MELKEQLKRTPKSPNLCLFSNRYKKQQNLGDNGPPTCDTGNKKKQED